MRFTETDVIDGMVRSQMRTLEDAVKDVLTLLESVSYNHWAELLAAGILSLARSSHDPTGFLSELIGRLEAAIPATVAAVERREAARDRADAVLAGLPAEDRKAIEAAMQWM